MECDGLVKGASPLDDAFGLSPEPLSVQECSLAEPCEMQLAEVTMAEETKADHPQEYDTAVSTGSVRSTVSQQCSEEGSQASDEHSLCSQHELDEADADAEPMIWERLSAPWRELLLDLEDREQPDLLSEAPASSWTAADTPDIAEAASSSLLSRLAAPFLELLEDAGFATAAVREADLAMRS